MISDKGFGDSGVSRERLKAGVLRIIVASGSENQALSSLADEKIEICSVTWSA
jgi:hypothetical protein